MAFQDAVTCRYLAERPLGVVEGEVFISLTSAWRELVEFAS
jgi:hypothetical protein